MHFAAPSSSSLSSFFAISRNRKSGGGGVVVLGKTEKGRDAMVAFSKELRTAEGGGGKRHLPHAVTMGK